ncbi:ABC transporter ATP-binding protein [Puteibacter caeruleilacunae]|nr:ABC transporter ATP-binding protein [Puteibacter caeruleilacunae]
MKELLKIENVDFSYNGQLVLEDVNLKIKEQDFLGIIGPNGGGKTTLLKLILGLEEPKKGNVRFVSDDVRSRVGYLPQLQRNDLKFPISVFDIVRSGFVPGKRFWQRYTRDENMAAERVLEEMGMIDFKHRPIGELSGGQMQRAFLCRAIVSDPRLLILDEPNTYVDNRFENELYSMLSELNERMAIVLVSHDLGTIASYVKTIACVNKHLHYHPSNVITPEQLAGYECPIQIISHGEIPHTVLKHHNHSHESNS